MATKRKPFVKLQCSECKNINYFVHKSKGLKHVGEKKLELKKFCKSERKHTIHKEVKK
jgi:large subunit ribosomal protein L33